MDIQVIGSGQEVGRSAILVEDVDRVLLDCGVKLQPEPPKYPKIPKDLSACIISHAHLDHSGGTPSIYSKQKIPIYMTDVTMELSLLLIKDSMKIAKKEKLPMPYSPNDVRRMMRQTKIVSYEEKFRIGNFECMLYDAGHIPGSAGILMKSGGKKIFYTGDIQTTPSNLLNPCKVPEQVDILITESTYSYRSHPKREKEERKFIGLVEEALANEVTTLIPVFAVGRAQEVLLMLEKYADKIAVDGMPKTAGEIISSYGYYLRDNKRLKNVLKRVHYVQSPDDRRITNKKYPILVSSAGMMSGGPVVSHLRMMAKNPENKVIFTGFLVEDTPGKILLDTGMFKNDDEKFPVKCKVEQLDLSAHTDRTGLFNLIKYMNPKIVISVHGDHCREFAKDIENDLEITAYAPKNGENIEV
jgi:putative mRNA 3-end processing factor